jgi:integrase
MVLFDVAEIWRAAPGSVIRMLLLTGQRRGEVARMTWAGISADYDVDDAR